MFCLCRCQEWIGGLQPAGPACCSALSCASPFCPRVVVGDPGAPHGAPPPAAPQQGVIGEGAPMVGPALASGLQGGRPRWGWPARQRQEQRWLWRQINGTRPPSAAATPTAPRSSWIITTGPTTLTHSCLDLLRMDFLSLSWFLLLLQLFLQIVDSCWTLWPRFLFLKIQIKKILWMCSKYSYLHCEEQLELLHSGGGQKLFKYCIF